MKRLLKKSAEVSAAVKITALFMLIPAVSACVFGCAGRKAEKELFAMDTYMILTVYGGDGEEALEQAAGEIRRIEKNFSVSSVTGEVETLLSEGVLENPSPEMLEMLDCAKILWERTGGAYDITTYPLSRLWGFGQGEFRVPGEAEISEALGAVGMDKLFYDSTRVELRGAGGIDFGSVAKGFAGREAAKILAESGVTGALLNLGGNIVTYGEKPDGSAFKIGIADPDDPDGICGYLTIEGGETVNVVTSGKYSRNFTFEGKTYHHIIDPRTGRPCENGVASVTVICGDGMWADALSTALFLLGKDGALEYYRNYGGFEAIIITDGGEIISTDGITENFTVLK